MAEKNDVTNKKSSFTLSVILDPHSEFKGEVAAFLFDTAGDLLEQVPVRDSKAVFSLSAQVVAGNRLFIGPSPSSAEQEAEKPSLRMMERLNAYEPALRRQGEIQKTVRVPSGLLNLWPICLCWVRGRVVKDESGLAVCGAKVHICEVDKLWRWIIRLPDLEVIRFRDDLINIIRQPILRIPPIPDPGPERAAFSAIKGGLLSLKSLKPQLSSPVALQQRSNLEAGQSASSATTSAPSTASSTSGLSDALSSTALPAAFIHAVSSNSLLEIREALAANATLIYPYLCRLLPFWPWRYTCDEIAVVNTDPNGHFSTVIFYSCKGDKPDLYFWVEYPIGGVMETVYKPSIPCNTYWDYSCGKEVVIRIKDARVPACSKEPDLPGSIVEILSIGWGVSMSEIQGAGAPAAAEGLTTSGEPFGGKIEPRVWFSRTTLRDLKKIHYYRWSYRRLTRGDGTLLPFPGPWTHLTRSVVRHYAVIIPVPFTVIQVPVSMGPKAIGGEANLFEIRPEAVPAGGIEWTVVDEREDLASGHFLTDLLGSGATPIDKALDGAGKYELKLELFKDTGALVDWTAEGVDCQVTDVPAPFGTGAVTAVSAPDYNRIKSAAGHTMAFRMVLHVDNNYCNASVAPVTGTGVAFTPCGFIEYTAGATATLSFNACHPNGFADFNFSVVRGVSTNVPLASASGSTSSFAVNSLDSPPSHLYSKPAVGSNYRATFSVPELLQTCTRAAYSEALHVWTRSTDGYGRLWYLDAFDQDAFALTPAP